MLHLFIFIFSITVKLCPAALTVRTTKDKQFLRITAFMPDHDHEPHAVSKKNSMLVMKKLNITYLCWNIKNFAFFHLCAITYDKKI